MVSNPLLWRVLAVLWALKIYWASTEVFSSNQTSPLLAALLDLLGIRLSPAAFWILHAAFRKLAHLFEYGVLSMLVYAGFCAGTRDRPALWALAISAAYAVTDELHQSFVRGRGASPVDCALDVAGAALALAAMQLAARWFPSRSPNTSPF